MARAHSVPNLCAMPKAAPSINGVRCRPSEGRSGSRVISPAWGALTYGNIDGMTLVPWPRYQEDCCGFLQAVQGSHGQGGPIDMSYISNYTSDNDGTPLWRVAPRHFAPLTCILVCFTRETRVYFIHLFFLSSSKNTVAHLKLKATSTIV